MVIVKEAGCHCFIPESAAVPGSWAININVIPAAGEVPVAVDL
jgi:hypothetical protein|tara:strand:- start:3378 stop:3506 length:129 start_codon:yes stop_codon:yes gene_type:complete